MKKIAFSMVMIFWLTQFVPGWAASESIDTMFLMASLYEQDGNLDAAGEMYQKILKQQEDPMIYEKLASIEEEKGNYDEAYKLLTAGRNAFPSDASLAFHMAAHAFTRATAPDLDPKEKERWMLESKAVAVQTSKLEKEPRSLVLLTMVAVQVKDYKTALSAYDTLIDELKMTEYYSARAVLKIESGDRKGGMADLKSASAKGDVDAMMRLADIYRQEGDNESAMKYLLDASEARPDLAIPDLYLGEMYRDSNDYDKSMQFYMQAARNMDGPMRISMLKEVGRLAMERNDFTLAAEAYKMALEGAPETTDDSRLYYLAFSAAALAGDHQAALDIFYEAIEIFPDYTNLRVRAAVSLIALERENEAIEVLQYIDPLERDLSYYLLLANAYSEQDMPDKAIAALESGLKDYSSNVDLLVSLAFLYDRAGRYDDTVATLRLALQAEPNSAIAQNFLGYLFADKNTNLDEAERLIDSALAQEPDNDAYMDSKAWVLYRKGKFRQAYDMLKKAMEHNPDDPEMLEHMDAIRKKLGISQ